MKIDNSAKGWFEVLTYIIATSYAWLNGKGIDAYVVSVLLGFMILDMILGVWKSIVVSTLENPTSRKAKRGILAKVMMLTIPIICGLIWGAFDARDGIRITNMMLTALMIAEGYSNIANAYSIYARKEIEEFDAVTFVFKKTAEKLKNFLEQIFDEKPENK